MKKSIVITFSALNKVVQGYAAWMYKSGHCSVLDTDKKIYIKATKENVEFILRTSSIIAKQKYKIESSLSDGEVWEFSLNYLDIQQVLANFQKLSCTEIESICLYEEGETIRMILHEKAKSGYPEQFSQDQKYAYAQTGIKHREIFDEMPKPITECKIDTQVFYETIEKLVPKMLSTKDSNTKIQVEDGYVITQDISCIYTMKNMLPDLLEDNCALNKEACAFLRNLGKYAKGKEMSGGNNENLLILYIENTAVYIYKNVLTSKKSMILTSCQPEWYIETTGAYFMDMLKRYEHVPEVLMSIYADSSTAYLRAGQIKQHMYLTGLSENANERVLYFNPKFMLGMLLNTNGKIRIRFMDKKGRRGSAYALCYVDGGSQSSWVCIMQARKGKITDV